VAGLAHLCETSNEVAPLLHVRCARARASNPLGALFTYTGWAEGEGVRSCVATCPASLQQPRVSTGQSMRDYRFLFKHNVIVLTLCLFFLFLAGISALAQTASHRNGPVKRPPPLGSHRDISPSPPEQPLTPRFRGWRHTPRAAMQDYDSHRGVGPSANSYVASSRLLSSSGQAVVLPPNGFDFRPSLLAGQIPTAVATGDFNGDGKLDWAISNGRDNSIWLYFGKGNSGTDGTFPIFRDPQKSNGGWLAPGTTCTTTSTA